MTDETLIALNARAKSIKEAMNAREAAHIEVEIELIEARATLVREARDAGYVSMFDGMFAKVATFNIE
jgi:hypothetical protein